MTALARSQMQRFVDLATHLADASGVILKRHFRRGISADHKVDGSPASIADREVERVLRGMILTQEPTHGIIGEEFGDHNTDSDFIWMLDPIDGTDSFLAGLPIFGTLISLTREGEPVLGIIDQPILAERWIGSLARPTTLNDVAVTSRTSRSLSEAVVYATHPDMFLNAAKDAWAQVSDTARRIRYGADCYAYAMLASGHIDAVVETGISNHDFSALLPIVEGAGGILTDWQGASPVGHRSSNVIAAAHGALHLEILEILNRKPL